MATGILLGNGINLQLNIQELREDNIFKRFKENLIRYNPIWRVHTGLEFTRDAVDSILDNLPQKGIESLCGGIYDYIMHESPFPKSNNLEIWVQDTIECVGLTSIWGFEHPKEIIPYDCDKMIDLSEYDYIYTLNYYEVWDAPKEVIYLHGYSNFGKKLNANTLIVSNHRKKYDKYLEALNELAKNYEIISIEVPNLIFAPSSVRKDRLVFVNGINPSDRLFPADDLIMYKKRRLYQELEKVDELDIYGMSPYGDQSLIDKINTMAKVRVFIYGLETSEETQLWKQRLECAYELTDSLEIKLLHKKDTRSC